MAGILIGLGMGLFVGIFAGAVWANGWKLWPAAVTGAGLGVGFYLAGVVVNFVVRFLDKQSHKLKVGGAP